MCAYWTAIDLYSFFQGLSKLLPPVEVNNCARLRTPTASWFFGEKDVERLFPRGRDVCLYSQSVSPCSEMLNSDEEQGVRGVNEGETGERRRKRGLIWRLHAATISSTQNGQTHCWNMHESFPSGGSGGRERSREGSSLFIKLHETALRD